ncbi:hypothetical protein [Spirosoma rigui]|uniref:hypothetical protein n=1 Tax=Spirosoma rigui TaxID=564064 RepID=UPI0009B14BD6|nr:hypothetical protein [Spirosoma rigui]
MNFAQRIHLLPFCDLLSTAETVQREISRRNEFIDRLPNHQLKNLPLTVQSRDLLYRIINEKSFTPGSKKPGEKSLSDLFKLLRVEDWLRIQYLNNRCFSEISEVLNNHKAPLERYYGELQRNTTK